jgi:hypothetical protein
MTKPLAKSLHTVTALIRVARHVQACNPTFSNTVAVDCACDILGYPHAIVSAQGAAVHDPYGLAPAAIKQMDAAKPAHDL